MGASGGGSISVTFIVVVPIMTNAVDVNNWEVLFFRKHIQEGDEANDDVAVRLPCQCRERAKGQSES